MATKSLYIWLPVVLLLGAACGKDPVAPEASYTLSIAGTAVNSAPAGAILPQALEVVVRNSAGAAVAGVIVEFRPAPGSTGTVEDGVAVSGGNGIARATVRLGPTVGVQEFDAAIRLRPSEKVNFQVNATEPPRLSAVSPASFEGGDTLRLSGSLLLAGGSPPVALIGGMPAQYIGMEGDSVLRAVAPACLPPGGVAVAVRSGTATTNTISASYISSVAPLMLAVGQGTTLRAASLGECVRLPSTLATYLVVPQFVGANAASSATSFVVGRDGAILPATVQQAAARAEAKGPASRFHDALREMEREIAPAVAAQPRIPRLARGAAVPPPPLNSTRSFDVLNKLSASPVTFTKVSARLRYAGDNILVYLDGSAPSGFNGFSEADIQSIGALFDSQLYELAAGTFGRESDLDGNGRVIVLMTPVVNSLVTRSECMSTGFVAGFFYPNDLYLNNTGSNRGEIFYTIVPDPMGTFSCAHPVAAVKASVPGTFIHELQHMISFNEHVLARGGSSEELWLNEALSLFAEELAGRHFNAKYPAPSGRSNPASLFADSADAFLIPVLANAYNFLAASRSTSVTSFTNFGDLRERGAAWLFLRWLVDQKGVQIVPRLVQTRTTGRANVTDKAGEPFPVLFGDFALTAAADLRPGFTRSSLAPRHRFTTFDLRAELAYTASRKGYPRPSPLDYTAIAADGSPVQSSMVHSTMSFFSLQKADASLAVMLRFAQPDLAPLPSALEAQLGIIRIQ